MEIKRRDSSTYMKSFQDKLIEKLLENSKEKENKLKQRIKYWLKEEIHKIRTQQISLTDIAFPCKLSRLPEDYKNTPIQVRSLLNTQKMTSSFKKKIGENYYYIYVKPQTKAKIKTRIKFKNLDIDDIVLEKNLSRKEGIKYANNQLVTSINDKEISVLHEREKLSDVLAFDEEYQRHIKDVNWDIMIERNIHSKAKIIFQGMGWNYSEIMEDK